MQEMSTHTVEIHVNGQLRRAQVSGSTTLLELLREQWGLTGTKDGCGEGDCGACTVIMDGQPVKSCLVLAVQAHGSQVTTVEGLVSSNGSLHPLQQAFVDTGAVQCGYCIPGMLLAAKALLDTNPQPNRAEIKMALSGNLCRCTGYSKIIEAVVQAAEQMQEENA
jgi:carbon-monoxide dehydrogenase small subunit